jgi:hypothetical protein
MTSTPAVASPRSNAHAPRIDADRRRHKRFELSLLGRFMRESKHEFPCKLIDISVGDLSVSSPVAVRDGEHIVAYFDQLGGLEGRVARLMDGGFGMTLQISANKREKLAAQLIWILNKDHLPGMEERRHIREPLVNKSTLVELGPGIRIECPILDVSMSGASVGTEARPAIGAIVFIGDLEARVMRHHDRGIGVEFTEYLDEAGLQRRFE